MKQKLSAYILFIRVKKKCRVGIGSLGVKEFKRGYYLYIGSGKKNLMERLKRHLKMKKKNFWHIDYLLKNSNVSILDIYITYLSEDEIFSVLKRQRNITPFLENFGSGDTSNLTHFFSVDKKESLVSILCKIEKWK
jgi:Uri superfamily endonuclease